VFAKIDATLVGRKVRCPCGCEFVVPQLTANSRPAEISPPIETLPPANAVNPRPAAIQNPSQGQPPGYWNPASSQTNPRPNPNPGAQAHQASAMQNSGNFRGIDIVFLVVGGFAALRGLSGLWGVYSSIMSIGMFSQMREMNRLAEEAGIDIPQHSSSIVLMTVASLLGSIAAIGLGLMGIAIIIHVVQLRNSGNNNFSWSILGGAIAAGITILFNLISVVVNIYAISQMASFNSGAFMASSCFGFIFWSLVPAATVSLFVYRDRLK